MKKHEIFLEEEKELFREDKMLIQKATVRMNKNGQHLQFHRLRVKRPDAVAVFIYNRDTRKVILVRQYRYAIADKIQEPVLEIMAGKIDGNDSPGLTAVREAEEECGYHISEERLKPLADFFVSPGYTSERFYLYFAEVSDSDRLSGGGGLVAENEYIEIVEVGYEEFLSMLDSGKIEDAKTLIAGLYVEKLNLIR